MDGVPVCDIGERLRHAREQRHLSVRDAAGITKLPIGVIHAIERNDFASLPAGIYRRGYLRTLAAEVRVDAEEIVQIYRQQFEPAIDTATATAPDDRQRTLIDQLAPSPRRAPGLPA